MNGRTLQAAANRFPVSRIALICIALFVVVVRVRLLGFPLERDEGEYAYIGQLFLQGVPPYSEAYSMKFPGTALLYALCMAVFGQTIEGVHLGLLAINCASITLVFLLGREVLSETGAVIAAGTYAMLSLSPSVYGFAAHATHFVTVFGLGGALLLHCARKQEGHAPYFWAGMLMGLSMLMKQPGFFFILFGAAYLVHGHYASGGERSATRLLRWIGIYAAGASAPLIATAAWIFAGGAFEKFWFWTVVYASSYGAIVPPTDAFRLFLHAVPLVVDGFSPLWVLAGAGFAVLLFRRDARTNRPFMLLFALFSFLSVCPGFYFRQHYYVTLLPAAALMTGLAADFLAARAAAFVPVPAAPYLGIGIFIAAAATGIAGQPDYYFKENPSQLVKEIYGANPFHQSLKVAQFIASRSSWNDSIAVLGSEPQIFFYAKRRSATGYLYTYSLMEKHAYNVRMQEEMIREVEASRPKFIVDVRVVPSWLAWPGSERGIFDWSSRYLREHYLLVGVVDMLSTDRTVYRWDGDARSYHEQSSATVLVYERI